MFLALWAWPRFLRNSSAAMHPTEKRPTAWQQVRYQLPMKMTNYTVGLRLISWTVEYIRNVFFLFLFSSFLFFLSS
jgi:hypothetical protein